MADMTHRLFDKGTSCRIAKNRELSAAQLAHLRTSLEVAETLVTASAPGAPEATVKAPGASMNFGVMAPCGNLIHEVQVTATTVSGTRHYKFYETRRSLYGEFCVERPRFHEYAQQRATHIRALLAAVDAALS